MTRMDKAVIRKPLAPIRAEEDCKTEYEKLLTEYNELKAWKVEGIDLVTPFHEKGVVVSLKEYNDRIGEYTQRRDTYNENYVGQIETVADVKANIKKLNEALEAAENEANESRHDREKEIAANHQFLNVFHSISEEESKFEELQKEADEAFEYVAKHTLVDGTVLTDEELAEREK